MSEGLLPGPRGYGQCMQQRTDLRLTGVLHASPPLKEQRERLKLCLIVSVLPLIHHILVQAHAKPGQKLPLCFSEGLLV